jgi:hypothetical protein
MALFKIFNGPAPTTASQAAVTTGTAIKTLLQVKPGATQVMKIKEWGICFDGSAAATPGIVELCVTDVAATVAAHVASGIHKLDAEALGGGDPTTSLFSVGTTATGYTASGEGTVGAVRQLDAQHIAPTNQFMVQLPLGEEFIVNPGEFMRIRVKFAAAENAICWVKVDV